MLAHTNPIWIPISLCEFALFLLFANPLRWRSNAKVADFFETCLAFVGWLAVHYAHLDFAFDFMLNVLVLALYIPLTRAARPQQSLYVSCIFVLCTEVGKILCVDFCMQPAHALFSQLPSWAITSIWALLSQGIALLAMLAIRRWAFSPGIERLTWKQSLSILLPLIPYILVRNSGYMYDTDDFDLYLNMVLISITLSVSTVIVIVANAHNLSSQIERNELLRMHALLKAQHAQYLAHKEATEAVRRQYHDLKHYVSELEAMQASPQETDSLARKKELSDFTSHLKRELEAYDAAIETGNEVLDILLAEKRQKCLAQGVRPVFYVDARNLGFVNSFDLCAIFGNLVDNAVEAAEKLPEDQPRDIQLDVRTTHGLVAIRCQNPFDGTLNATPEGLRTTKSDRENHGFGLKSVRQVVKRYGGTLTWHADNGVFEATVIIPLPG